MADDIELPICRKCGKSLDTIDEIIKGHIRRHLWLKQLKCYGMQMITKPESTYVCSNCNTILTEEQIEFLKKYGL